MNKGPLVTLLLLLTTPTPPAHYQDGGSGTVPAVFSSYSVLTATIEAPFAELIENGRERQDYSVTGVLKLSDGHGSTTVDNIRITTRGHTSLRKRLQYDLFYIRNWSIMFDLRILWMTIFRGFVHPNAH